jgi:hypothetical protein
MNEVMTTLAVLIALAIACYAWYKGQTEEPGKKKNA